MAGKRRSNGTGGRPEVKATVDHSAYDKFAADLARKLPDETASALGELGEQFVAETRRAVRSGRGSGPGSRARAARGIRFQVRGGKLQLISDPSVMDQGREAFPAAWNSASWQHPVFGRRDKVTQRGNPGWWRPERYGRTAAQLLDRAADRAQKAADR